MPTIINSYSGKRKFFRGKGRTGSRKIGPYQQMLLLREEVNKYFKKGLTPPLELVVELERQEKLSQQIDDS